MRIALGITYGGTHYDGWQSQPSGRTVQDHLQIALARFMAGNAPQLLCAGRTDAGVHGLMQVAHFDTDLQRSDTAWMRACGYAAPIAAR
ncbi:MAG: tRNA pseudouridine(38-40) synthase TruA, partial [Burkholderiaceae bacterium]